MKLKIVLCEPPTQELKAAPDEKLVIVASPYKIFQAKLADTRVYIKADGSKKEGLTYERYCQKIETIIQDALDKSSLSEAIYKQITIVGFREPPNFRVLCSKLEAIPLSCAAKVTIEFRDCAFGGQLYTDATSQLLRSIQKRHSGQAASATAANLTFEISLTEQKKAKLSKLDEIRLALVENVVFRKPNNAIVLRPWGDDSLIGVKKTPLVSRLSSPTFFFYNAKKTRGDQTVAEMVLKNFFSQESQQQNDYTCGPAALIMYARYICSMRKQGYCGAELSNPEVWDKLTQTPEMLLAKQVKTTEADGSNIPDIRNALIQQGITVFDDNGLSNKRFNNAALIAHKELLLDKLHQILKLGVPIILNMHDKTGGGHFEVLIGIEKRVEGGARKEHIILAEPGTALIGNPKFERVPRNKFIARWKNSTGVSHGRFMVLSPNETTTMKIDAILADVPNCKNGVDRGRVLQEYSSSLG